MGHIDYLACAVLVGLLMAGGASKATGEIVFDFETGDLQGWQVVEGLACFVAPAAEPVKRLMEKSTYRLLVEAVGGAPQLYTRDYVRRLERHSPFRFSFVQERRSQMAGQSAAIMALIEAFARFDPGDSPAPFPLP